MKKNKCNNCKNKPLTDLNKIKNKEESYPTLVKVLIFMYTILAVYGGIRLVLDLNNLLKTLF